MDQLHMHTVNHDGAHYDTHYIQDVIAQSFKNSAPFWPLKNLIAVNPLQGLEHLPIEQALALANAYFQQKDLPARMYAVNCETIKWLQVYCDDGQATLPMPLRHHGMYTSWRQLAVYDARLHKHDKQKQTFLRELPQAAEEAIAQCLEYLRIAKEEHVQFLTLMLTTLPGWSSHVAYRTKWARADESNLYPMRQEDYVAIRLIISTLLWPKAKELLDWHKKAVVGSQSANTALVKMEIAEKAYRTRLLQKLATQAISASHTPAAQLIFCIDVRSEQFRKSLESTGDYQTLGFAGFFGIPAQITNVITHESYASCPVLISPKHTVKESPCSPRACENDKKGYERLVMLKSIYQSVKYAFTTPFALVESIGILSGVWMAIRSLMPRVAAHIKIAAVEAVRKTQELEPRLDTISLSDQCSYALNALKMMGFTSNFAPIIVLCGHGSTTQNNAYETALDCGACGGRHGGGSARILAAILNQKKVRAHLIQNGICIPQTTRFIAAEHNTTTDEVTLYNVPDVPEVESLRAHLQKARAINSQKRLEKMGEKTQALRAVSDAWLRAHDWAQVRPEWGLARNAAFIVGPRDLTASLDLEGRCFLHSYDYKKDPQGAYLTAILTAPMVVGQWINTQYLFSTLDNVAYGAGSKITLNITGKLGVMQGNASDLMTGLPLQSVYSSDTQAYHEAQRLLTVVFAPQALLDTIIQAQPVLHKLLGNGWAQLVCMQPDDRTMYLLNRDFTWQRLS